MLTGTHPYGHDLEPSHEQTTRSVGPDQRDRQEREEQDLVEPRAEAPPEYETRGYIEQPPLDEPPKQANVIPVERDAHRAHAH